MATLLNFRSTPNNVLQGTGLRRPSSASSQPLTLNIRHFMQPPIRKDRLALVVLIFALAAAAPSLIGVTFPAAAPYMPPFFLSSLALLTAVKLLLVWRANRLPLWLRPDASSGRPGAKELRNIKIGVGVSSVLVVVLTILWVSSWP